MPPTPCEAYDDIAAFAWSALPCVSVTLTSQPASSATVCAPRIACWLIALLPMYATMPRTSPPSAASAPGSGAPLPEQAARVRAAAAASAAMAIRFIARHLLYAPPGLSLWTNRRLVARVVCVDDG